MSNVSDLWENDPDIGEFTDTDLVAARNQYTELTDPEYNLHSFVSLLHAQYGCDVSATYDRALRAELAYLIDNQYVDFQREDFDVAFTIPPAGWLQNIEHDFLNFKDRSVELGDRAIGFGTAPVVYDMAQEALNQGAHDTVSNMVKEGSRRLLDYTNLKKDPGTLPIAKLFASETSRKLIDFVIDGADDDAWYRQTDLVAATGQSPESIRKYVGVNVDSSGSIEWKGLLLLVNIFEVRDPEVNIRHYRVSDSKVVQRLRSWDGPPVTELFETSARRTLVKFFVGEADPTTAYSKSAVTRTADISYSGVDSNIDKLSNTDLIKECEGKRGIEYMSNTHSQVAEFCWILNNMLFELLSEKTNSH